MNHMEIVNHPLCDQVVGAPSDMQDGTCSDLPVHRYEDEHGPWAVSFWKPDAAEMTTLNAGGTIALHVRAAGRQHPVVGVTVQPAVEPA